MSPRPSLTLQIPVIRHHTEPTIETYLNKRWGSQLTPHDEIMSPVSELERELLEAEMNQGCVDRLQDVRLPWAEKTRVRVGRYPAKVRLDSADVSTLGVCIEVLCGIVGLMRV